MKSINPKFLKAAVYGANDGIITTFAVVAGVVGAQLSPEIVIILGIANMVADAVSMGIGDFLGERSEQKLRQIEKKPFESEGLWHTGLVTFIAFVLAGSLPLIPYVVQIFGINIPSDQRFIWSILATMGALFLVGSLRTRFTRGNWWLNGLEMLAIGAIAAVIAFGLGYAVDNYVLNPR